MSPERQPQPSTVGEVLEYLSRLSLPEQPMEGLLQRVTDLVKAVMPGRSEASVTLLVQERPSTLVATGRLAVDLDEGQYERGHGPCLHVAATRETAEIRAAAIGPSLPRTVDRRSRRSPGRSCPPVIGGGSERGWNGRLVPGFSADAWSVAR